MTTPSNSEQPRHRLTEKLNLETAKIPWLDLQSFFARGEVIAVAAELDLLLVAEQVAADNAQMVEQWMSKGQLAKVSDEQARQWHSHGSDCWAVVIKPWVLVQEAKA